METLMGAISNVGISTCPHFANSNEYKNILKYYFNCLCLAIDKAYISVEFC